MTSQQHKKNLRALAKITSLVVALREAEEGAAMKGDVDDLLLPLARLRKTMNLRGDVLATFDKL